MTSHDTTPQEQVLPEAQAPIPSVEELGFKAFQITSEINTLVRELNLPIQLQAIMNTVGVLIVNYRAGSIPSDDRVNAQMRVSHAQKIYDLLLELKEKTKKNPHG